jgi:hypothetical protein
MARKRKPELPATGSAFAIRLGDGRYSACRVLAGAGSRRKDAILVACSGWIGDRVPVAEDPGLRPILVLNHHSWNDRPEILWVSDGPPKDFISLGMIEPTPEEHALECNTFGGWESVRIQPLLQWRWDHDREALLAEDAREKEKQQKISRAAQRERNRHLKKVTLNELRERRFFPRWKGYPPVKALRASRRLMKETVEKLLALGPRPSRRDRMTVLQECIETFNSLDAEMEFIETVVREDICEEFEAIVHACGMGAHKNLADEWRDW